MRQPGQRPPLALCYHGVGEVPVRVDRSRLFVTPRDLERHIDALSAWGYRFVTFGELARATEDQAAQGLVSLTFDDGLVELRNRASPLVGGPRLPATAFVVSGWLGRSHPDAPWSRATTESELRQLSAAGIEIGGHSTRHDHLPDLTRDAAAADMLACRLDLEELIQRPVRVFAYPYGGATADTRAACASAGYDAACRSAGAGCWGDPFDLPRQDMQNRGSVLGLRLKRNDLYEPLIRTVPGLAARRAFRGVRRLVP